MTDFLNVCISVLIIWLQDKNVETYYILQETETGLYVCLNTFLGFGKKHVEPYFRKTGNGVFLHLRRIRKEVSYLLFSYKMGVSSSKTIPKI